MSDEEKKKYETGTKLPLGPEIFEEVKAKYDSWNTMTKNLKALVFEIKDKELELEKLKSKIYDLDQEHSKIKESMWKTIYMQYPDAENCSCSFNAERKQIEITNESNDFLEFMTKQIFGESSKGFNPFDMFGKDKD